MSTMPFPPRMRLVSNGAIFRILLERLLRTRHDLTGVSGVFGILLEELPYEQAHHHRKPRTFEKPERLVMLGLALFEVCLPSAGCFLWVHPWQ